MLALGIDIGGTSIKGGAVNEKGEVLSTFSLPIEKEDNQDVMMDKLVASVKEYLSSHSFPEPITGIGMGIPGSIDSKKGIVTYSNNLNWTRLHVIERFKKDFSLPVRITNDANAAALGEARYGAGRSYPNMIMITLGTGVGSGIILNGKIYEGMDGKGAEIGHSLLKINGYPCTCGRKGCLEAYASATALDRFTKEAMDAHKDSLLWKVSEEEGRINGKVPFIAARMMDKTAMNVVNKYVRYLGEGLLNICNIFRPECIVLSGGIANEGDYLIKKLKRYCARRDYGYPLSPKTEIKVAEVGYKSGLIGAASLFF